MWEGATSGKAQPIPYLKVLDHSLRSGVVAKAERLMHIDVWSAYNLRVLGSDYLAHASLFGFSVVISTSDPSTGKFNVRSHMSRFLKFKKREFPSEIIEMSLAIP